MNFRDWILLEEKPTRIVGNTDPTTMAGVWDLLSPGNPAQSQVNIGEVWNMVRKLSNNNINRVWMKVLLEGFNFPGIGIYEADLAKMVKIPDIEGTVQGGITSKAEFYCTPQKIGDKIVSEVMIATPPCEYDNEERAVLSSIIIHELRHAIDFHELKSTVGADYTQDRGSHYEIDMDLYARNIFEARAWADQTKILMTTLGGCERTKRVIQESILARGFIPRLRESMLEFVNLICRGKTESFENPPAIVVQDENKIEQVVELVRHIVESFKFSRFIKMA